MGAAVVGLRFFPELEAAALVSGVLAAIPESRTAVGDGDCKSLATSLVGLTELVDRQAECVWSDVWACAVFAHKK